MNSRRNYTQVSGIDDTKLAGSFKHSHPSNLRKSWRKYRAKISGRYNSGWDGKNFLNDLRGEE
jgi:hypothetical protein